MLVVEESNKRIQEIEHNCQCREAELANAWQSQATTSDTEHKIVDIQR